MATEGIKTSEDRADRIRRIDLEEAEADAADLGLLAYRWYRLAEAATGPAGGDPRAVLAQLRDELHAALVWTGDDPHGLSDEGRAAALDGAAALTRAVAANLTTTEGR
jgi:hypothetical protein